MTMKERYNHAFSALRASDSIELCSKPRRIVHTHWVAAICTLLAVAVISGSAFAIYNAYEKRTYGWGKNFEIIEQTDENGRTIKNRILHTDSLTDPVRFEADRMIFVVNGEKTDITDLVSEDSPFAYTYADAQGNTHYWFVGLNSGDMRNYGYAEYICSADGEWLGGYSARTNIDENGTGAPWLEAAKAQIEMN